MSYCNILEGYKGIAYKPRLVDTKAIRRLSKISTACLLSDDFIISYVLAANKVDRIRISNFYFNKVNQFKFGFQGDALHKAPNLYLDDWSPRWSWGSSVGVTETSHRYQRCAYELNANSHPTLPSN